MMIMARIFILGHTKDTAFLYNGIILKKFNYSLNRSILSDGRGADMKKILLCALICLLIPIMGACAPARSKTGLKTSDEAPKFSFVGKAVSPFEVTDLEGRKFNEGLFKKQKLTMTVFWSPNCVPCIEELEALEKIYDQEEALGIKLISVCVEGKLKDIEDLKRSYPMSYPIVMLDRESLMGECVKDFEFIPFVIFVDQDGKYMKDYLVGSRTYDEYMTHINKLLEQL